MSRFKILQRKFGKFAATILIKGAPSIKCIVCSKTVYRNPKRHQTIGVNTSVSIDNRPFYAPTYDEDYVNIFCSKSCINTFEINPLPYLGESQ